MGDSGSMHLERVLGFPGQQFGQGSRTAHSDGRSAIQPIAAARSSAPWNGRSSVH